jgi:uncharacterized protein YaiL (DUF2058 family)
LDKNETEIELMQTEETKSFEQNSIYVMHDRTEKELNSDNITATDKSKEKKDFKMIEIEVQLPDNEAICQYNHAEKEKLEAEKKFQNLNKEIEKVETKLEIEFQLLEEKILDLKEMCVDFNFADQFKNHLNQFEEKVNSYSTAPHLKNYFDRLMNLIN